jgi:hypothetical protein
MKKSSSTTFFIDLSIYKLYHLGTVNFKYVLYIFIKKHVNVEAISNKRIVPSMSYNSGIDTEIVINNKPHT